MFVLQVVAQKIRFSEIFSFWFGNIGDCVLIRIREISEFFTEDNLFCELVKKIGSIVPCTRIIQLPPGDLSIFMLAI